MKLSAQFNSFHGAAVPCHDSAVTPPLQSAALYCAALIAHCFSHDVFAFTFRYMVHFKQPSVASYSTARHPLLDPPQRNIRAAPFLDRESAAMIGFSRGLPVVTTSDGVIVQVLPLLVWVIVVLALLPSTIAESPCSSGCVVRNFSFYFASFVAH
jgi:hypothetical protein